LRSRRRQHELRQLYAMQHQHIAAQAALLVQLRARDQALQDLNATLEQQVTARTAALRHEMAERQRLEREAQRVQHFALLGQLAAGVSHEIRNPLAAVFLYVDLLAEELQQPTPDKPAAVAEALAEIKTNLARLDDLVQDYLTLVRVGSIQRTPEDLGHVVQAWAAEFQALAAPHGVRLQLEGLADLGIVAVHAATLRRAVLNLVQNALEAMPQGGTLTLTGRRTPTHVALQIRDTGSGIASAHRAKIFEPLYTTKPGGTGLGLYIVHEIVAAHGGEVTVESAEGQGTTVTLTLPLAGSEAGAAS
jgi:signal transduction histidine kinase